jgi:hypothetical protein
VPLIAGCTYGSVSQHLEPDHIAHFPVPRFADQIELRVHDLVEEAASLLSKYQEQINLATTKLFEAVGLNDITAAEWHERDPDLGFYRRVTGSASLRAVNYNPRFQQLCSRIREHSWRSLADLCKPGTLRRGMRYKRIDGVPEHTYELIGQKEIFFLRPNGRWIAKKSVGEDVFVQLGATLVAAQGTLGESELYCKCKFVSGPALASAYSEHFLRVVSDESVMPADACSHS